MPADKIFVCYRRDDSAGHAGRVYDRLNHRFAGRVFMDVASINVGTRWAEVIEQTLRSCRVAVVLIGRRWLAVGADGKRRLDDPDDPIRAEIQTALRLRLTIVPLLVAGGALPDRDDLPSDIAPMLDWQALRIDDDDFDHDTKRLIRSLESMLHERPADLDGDDTTSREEIRQLLASAERAAMAADWITAAQTLRSVLALDPGHAEAAARLRTVESQWRREYGPARQSKIPRWAVVAAAVFGGFVLLGVLMQQAEEGAFPEDDSQGSSFVGPQPAPTPTPAPPSAAPIDDTPVMPPPTAAAPGALSMTGDYTLVSYALQGIPQPVSGSMRLVQIAPAAFQFDSVGQTALGMLQYRGTLRAENGAWFTTVTQTNDPTAVAGAIPTTISFDGSTLAMQNSFGQTWIWRRQ